MDYETLRVIWWLLLGALLIGFAIMDGFDLGIGMLLYGVAKTNDERRVALNVVGPVWEGNQVWLILGGGAIFAAWPTLYAVSFSGFYLAMLLVLLGLILRPVGFKFRGKIHKKGWRQCWDAALFLAGFLPAFVFGVAMGNVLQGVPFHFDITMRAFYTGGFFDLLNPFALLCGIVSVAMLCMHGASFLAVKTLDNVQRRAALYARVMAVMTILLFALAGYLIANQLDGFVLTSELAHDGPSNPLHKTVVKATGAWLMNYQAYPLFKIAPIAGFVGAVLNIIFISCRFYRFAFISSAVSILGIISSVGSSMFPFILPSSSVPNVSLLVWDASSSRSTLMTMLIATFIFLPIIIGYTSWLYYVLRGKTTEEEINRNPHSYY